MCIGSAQGHVPGPLAEGVESELVGDLGSVHGVGQILGDREEAGHKSDGANRRTRSELEDKHVPACWRRREGERLEAHPRSTFGRLDGEKARAERKGRSAPTSRSTQIHPDWVDYNGHLRDAFYLLIFSYATDALMDTLDRAGQGAAGRLAVG